MTITVAGGGTATIGSDEIGAAQIQRFKIGWGVDGSYSDASATAPIPVQNIASGLTTGRKTITTAGTAEVIAASTVCRSVIVVALPTNTNRVAIGDSVVDVADSTFRGIPLNAGDSVSLLVSNLNQIWLDVLVNGEGISFAYLTT